MSKVPSRKYRLEALQACLDIWDDVRPPEWWSDESGEHDGSWTAKAAEDVVRAFTAAYPNLPPGAKPYRRFRVTPAGAARRFRIVEESTP